MKFIRNPEIEHELLDRVEAKYDHPREEMPHLSELIYCMTRSFFQRFDPLGPTAKDTVMTSLGFALEEVYLRNGGAPKTKELDGVWMTLDYVALADGQGLDLKSTRMRISEEGQPEKFGWPKGWLTQFMGYARLMGQEQFHVAIVSYIAATLTSGTFIFDPDEIEDSWAWVLERRDVFIDAVFAGEAPQPFKHNEDWECRDCRYLGRCNAWALKKSIE